MTGDAKGIGIALIGSLALVPDTLFMRLSGLDAMQMVAWRGLLLAGVLLTLWSVLSDGRARDLSRFASVGGLGAVGAQAANALLFAYGVGHAPVAIVLVALATTPICAAIMGALFLGDHIGRSTLAASAAVLVGIAISAGGGTEPGFGSPIVGALSGFAVAMALSSSFTIFRACPALPVLLAVGLGAAIAGVSGTLLSKSLFATEGWFPGIWITGCIILPISFTTLNIASRYTIAANVSLLLLLETVLGPMVVWMVIGESVGAAGLVGGAVVVCTLAIYLWDRRRRSLRGPPSRAATH